MEQNKKRRRSGRTTNPNQNYFRRRSCQSIPSPPSPASASVAPSPGRLILIPATSATPAQIAGRLEQIVFAALRKITSRFVRQSTKRSTVTNAQPFTVSLHDGQLPRADAGAHTGGCGFVPSGHGHRSAITDLRWPRTVGLSTRAMRSHWVRGFVSRHHF